jgi:hypothetical protein
MLVNLLITIGILSVCIALLSIRLLVKKEGEFPSTHVDASPAMRERGIHCVRTQDYMERQRKKLSDLTEKK